MFLLFPLYTSLPKVYSLHNILAHDKANFSEILTFPLKNHLSTGNYLNFSQACNENFRDTSHFQWRRLLPFESKVHNGQKNEYTSGRDVWTTTKTLTITITIATATFICIQNNLMIHASSTPSLIIPHICHVTNSCVAGLGLIWASYWISRSEVHQRVSHKIVLLLTLVSMDISRLC